MASFMLTIGILTLLSGTGLIYWINRRKFYRRNVAGLEGFSSYEASVLVRLIERIGKWFAVALIIFSLFFFTMYFNEKKRIDSKQANLQVKDKAK